MFIDHSGHLNWGFIFFWGVFVTFLIVVGWGVIAGISSDLRADNFLETQCDLELITVDTYQHASIRRDKVFYDVHTKVFTYNCDGKIITIRRD